MLFFSDGFTCERILARIFSRCYKKTSDPGFKVCSEADFLHWMSLFCGVSLKFLKTKHTRHFEKNAGPNWSIFCIFNGLYHHWSSSFPKMSSIPLQMRVYGKKHGIFMISTQVTVQEVPSFTPVRKWMWMFINPTRANQQVFFC